MLKKNDPIYGLWVTLESASITEMAVALGLDWVVIDAEHGYLDWKDINSHISAALRSDTVVLVRIAERSTILCKRALDIGVDGIMIPWMEKVEEVEEAEDLRSSFNTWLDDHPERDREQIRDDARNLWTRLDRPVGRADNYLWVVDPIPAGWTLPFVVKINNEKMKVEEVAFRSPKREENRRHYLVRVTRGINGLGRPHPVGSDIKIVRKDSKKTEESNSEIKADSYTNMTMTTSELEKLSVDAESIKIKKKKGDMR